MITKQGTLNCSKGKFSFSAPYEFMEISVENVHADVGLKILVHGKLL